MIFFAVVLNRQHSSWDNVNIRVLQGSVLGSLLFLIHYNHLSNGVSSNCEPFAHNTSLSTVIGVLINGTILSNDFTVKGKAIGLFKMIF